MELRNTYYLMRHGQAVSNQTQRYSSWPEKFENPLTDLGTAEVKESAEALKGTGINMIFSSDVLRTKQTAELIAASLKLEVIFDTRLREIGFGIFNGMPIDGLNEYFQKEKKRIAGRPPEGENYGDVLERVMGFINEVDRRYEGKTVLVIGHEAPLWILEAGAKGMSLESALGNKRLANAEVKKLDVAPSAAPVAQPLG